VQRSEVVYRDDQAKYDRAVDLLGDLELSLESGQGEYLVSELEALIAHFSAWKLEIEEGETS